MPNQKKSKSVPEKAPQKKVKDEVSPAEKPEPKKKVSRAKAKPTKEEALKMLQDASGELKQIIYDLKEDDLKLCSLQLKRVPELVRETLKNLEEDKQELDEEYEELLKLPAEN